MCTIPMMPMVDYVLLNTTTVDMELQPNSRTNDKVPRHDVTDHCGVKVVLQTAIDMFNLTGMVERKPFYDLTEGRDCEFRLKLNGTRMLEEAGRGT